MLEGPWGYRAHLRAQGVGLQPKEPAWPQGWLRVGRRSGVSTKEEELGCLLWVCPVLFIPRCERGLRAGGRRERCRGLRPSCGDGG